MIKAFHMFLILSQLCLLISSADLTISRTTRIFPEKHNNLKLTPFLVSLSSEDIFKKVKNVDLICIIDVSGSMGGDKINLVKESLTSLVNLMTKDDRIALIPFASSASSSRYNLNYMTSDNQKEVKNFINSLKASGGTNIYSGLKAGLDILPVQTEETRERIVSMILLSDGEDNYANAESKFREALKSYSDYIFTLHSFGYGDKHDAELMNSISKIRYGGYFFIRQLSMVQEALVEIYGSLSTVNKINVNLTIKSNFDIKYYNGIEDDFKLADNTFNIKIYHFVYGKKYNYELLIDVPENTEKGTIILTATALDLERQYEWEDVDDNGAYESYIKYICINDFDNSYTKAKSSKVSDGINIINNGKQWLKVNYNGKEEWDKEYDAVLTDLNYFSTYGKPSLLSKLRELKYIQLGLNYHDENSYQRKLIDDSYEVDIDTNTKKCLNITKEQSIEVESGSYYYFSLEKGIGEIDNLHFSEEKNIILIYTESKTEINIKPLSDDFSICYIPEKKTKIKYEVNPFKGVKFSFEKDFPFEFYSRVDGTKDITFNIQFTNLEIKEGQQTDQTDESDQAIIDEEIKHDFIIKAYILNENTINTPTGTELSGFYDRMHRVGKFVIRKEEISKYISLNYKNYIYIIIQKNTDYNIEYTKVIGQLSFVSMDYVFADIPEGFYVFSNLPQNEKNPHKYRFKLDPEKGKTTRIEFISSANELSCAIIKYDNEYEPGSEVYYNDLNDPENIEIVRLGNKMGKEYIDIKANSTKDTNEYEYLVITIFSTNGGHITGTEIEKLSYAIRYTTSSNYGIYSFKDSNNGGGESVVENIEDDSTKKKVSFHSLESASESEGEYKGESTRFFLKLYKIIKQRQKLYRSIALFEYSYPIKTYEKEVNSDSDAYFILDEIDPDINYFYTLFTVSNKNNEILSYESQKIFKDPTNFNIEDDKPYENELDKEQNINITLPDTTEYSYLMIKISDFDEGKYGTIEARVEDQYYKSVQPSTTNYVLIPVTDELFGKKVNIKIKLKDHESTGYFLTMKLTDNLELYVGEKASIEIQDESFQSLDVKLSENGGIKNNIKLIIQSIKGDFEINNLDIPLSKSDMFKSQFGFLSIVDSKGISFQINSKLGDFITISSYMINNNKQKKIKNYEINRYGYLAEGEDCISLNQDLSNIEKYQVRILGDKTFNIKYNSNIEFDILEPGSLYMKSLTNSLEQICLFRTDKISESAFYSLQIIDTTKQQTTTDILLPVVMENIYNDILEKNEVRYYTQGTFESEPDNDLEYFYKVKQIKGEIKVYKTQCNNYPFCQYSKDNLDENNFNEIYNIDEYFIYSKKATDFEKYDSQNIPVFIVLCLSDSCEYNFIIEKSNSLINLSKLEKYSSKINKNTMQKFSITPSENYELISIDLYTHSGELDLSSNENCKDIKYKIFGNLETIEIPKSCQIKNSIEVYIQANMDSVYTIEYKNILDSKVSKIKSNIIHMEYINKEKNIEFTPIKNSYFIKFIPINCEINIKYKINDKEKNINSLQNIYYYDSDSESEKIYSFTIETESEECMIYTYIEEFADNYYSILSDQIPYYLSSNNKFKTYKLLYPIPNQSYSPMFKINFFEDIPIKILQSINGVYADEIDAVFTKDIIPSTEFLKNCKSDEICYLTLEIKYDGYPETPIILEIIPKSNNEIPAVLFDNMMRQDFIKLGGEQQYMAKILKDEEGEVSFNYKHFSGELIANLIDINKHSWKNRYYLPEQNEQLIYDKLTQKIIFTKKETNRCSNGCYLLIEVHTFDNFNKDKNDIELNMDYSIYLKKNDKILNLKLNEYIMGSLLKTLDENNYIEYYSIQIPYSTKKIYIDYSSENTVILINDDNIKPTKENKKHIFNSNGLEQVFVIDSKEDLKDKIFIIGIYSTKLENGISQYNIRIRAENDLYKQYIYSDSNTNNLCETKNNNQNCYFIIPITHKQKDYDIVFFVKSSENNDDLIIRYKTMNITTDKDDGQYSYSSEGQFIKNMLLIKKEDLPQNENENILIKVEVPIASIINLLYTYNTGLNENLLSPKNKILYNMNPNEELYLTIPNSVRSLIHFDVISGKGSIGYENDDKSMIYISGKYSSMFLQSTENNQNKRIKIITSNSNYFYFYAYIKLDSQKRNMNEINNGNSIIKSNQGFPLEFYSYISLNDYIINFNINNLKSNPSSKKDKVISFSLLAYIIPEEIIEELKNDESYVYDDSPFIGKYETGFGIAKLEISKEEISKYYTKDKNNYIYIIIQSSNSNPYILKNIEGQVTVLPKNNNNYPLPENTYINAKLEPGTNNNIYKLIKKDSKDKKMRIEFSANSDNIDYMINYDNQEKANFTEKENFGKKIIDVDLLNISDFINFEIKYKDNESNATDDISYTIRYRTDEGNLIFKNYTQDGDVEIDDKSTNVSLKYKKINITIPAIKEEDTGNNIDGIYYLKIYKRENDSDYINGTISVVDGLEPYKVYEFKIEGDYYNKTLEIPNDKNDYYIIISAVTNDKELLSYNKPLLIEYKEKEEDDTSDSEEDSSDIHDDSSDNTDYYDNQTDYTDYYDNQTDYTDYYENQTDYSDDIDNNTDTTENESDSTHDSDIPSHTDSSDSHDDSTDHADSSDSHDDSTDHIISSDTSDSDIPISDSSSKTDSPCEDCSSFKEENNSLIIVIIVISVICFLLILVIIHMALKLRKNKIEDVDIDTGNADEIPLKDSAQADN